MVSMLAGKIMRYDYDSLIDVVEAVAQAAGQSDSDLLINDLINDCSMIESPERMSYVSLPLIAEIVLSGFDYEYGTVLVASRYLARERATSGA